MVVGGVGMGGNFPMIIPTNLNSYFRGIESDIAHDRGRLAMLLDLYMAPADRGRVDDLLVDLISAVIVATLAGAGVELVDDSEAGGDLLY